MNIENTCILSWNLYDLVLPVNYCPKRFQKQWQIQLHDICFSSIPCSSIFPYFLPLPPGCVSLCQQCRETSWTTSFSFDLKNSSNFLVFYFHNFNLQSAASLPPLNLINLKISVQHQACATLSMPTQNSKACAPPPGSWTALQENHLPKACPFRKISTLSYGASIATTLQNTDLTWLVK